MIETIKKHWPEYLMEAAGLGIFMISAGAFGTLLEFPGSPVHLAMPDPFVRRVLMGLAMGLTAIGIIYSPWGKQSGAHINPAVTLTFWRLGKVASWDAIFYVTAQFVGGITAMILIIPILGMFLADPAVNFVVTLPGKSGVPTAFVAEALISCVLMLVILLASNNMSLARFTGIFAAMLVATYIAFEAPISGMSMNPARSFASAVPARLWTAFWIYLTAPPLGMLLAVEIYARLRKTRSVICAKLHHANSKRCIFHCGYMQRAVEVGPAKTVKRTNLAKV